MPAAEAVSAKIETEEETCTANGMPANAGVENEIEQIAEQTTFNSSLIEGTIAKDETTDDVAALRKQLDKVALENAGLKCKLVVTETKAKVERKQRLIDKVRSLAFSCSTMIRDYQAQNESASVTSASPIDPQPPRASPEAQIECEVDQWAPEDFHECLKKWTGDNENSSRKRKKELKNLWKIKGADGKSDETEFNKGAQRLEKRTKKLSEGSYRRKDLEKLYAYPMACTLIHALKRYIKSALEEQPDSILKRVFCYQEKLKVKLEDLAEPEHAANESCNNDAEVGQTAPEHPSKTSTHSFQSPASSP